MSRAKHSSVGPRFQPNMMTLDFRILDLSRGCIVSMKAIGTIIKQMGGRLRIMATPEPSFEMTVSRSRVDDFMAWLER